MELVAIGAAVVVVVLSASGVWRFTVLRRTGSQGLLRELPASGIHGWRHGVFRYSDENLKFYKLRSLAFASDVVLRRRGSRVEGFRELTTAEREFMPRVDRVAVLSGPGWSYEFASDRRAAMALVSWIESAPSERYMGSPAKAPARLAQGRAHRS